MLWFGYCRIRRDASPGWWWKQPRIGDGLSSPIPASAPPYQSLGADDGSQSLTIGAHRSAVASMAPCLCVDALPLMGVFTELLDPSSESRTTPGAARPAP